MNQVRNLKKKRRLRSWH